MPHPPSLRQVQDQDAEHLHPQITLWDRLSLPKPGKAPKKDIHLDPPRPLARRNSSPTTYKKRPISPKSSTSIFARLPASLIPNRKASRNGRIPVKYEAHSWKRRTRSASLDNFKETAGQVDSPIRQVPIVQDISTSASQIPGIGVGRGLQEVHKDLGDNANSEQDFGETQGGGRGRSGSSSTTESSSRAQSPRDVINDPQFREEAESRWILNLTMASYHSPEREKFFITYAELPNKWRRVTVSCDYTGAPEGSLEAELKSLHYQDDKSARIYEAIRESLATVKFYDTVTHLELRTEDERLHVHVAQDMNEIIKYPSVSAVAHLSCKKILERDIDFDSHMSGFVYKVTCDGEPYVKKEIPGRDMVDEFLYEINALAALSESANVINLEALVVEDDEEGALIKGLLVSFAERGALADLLFDNRDAPLPWPLRAKWAKQIVSGLADIHETGFVQGDFTLANIVIDEDDNVRIIDINRRGCPVGWEPPEFKGILDSSQRISMYIGVKSDLYQLGMVLWGLAANCDVPELEVGPLRLDYEDSDVPLYFRGLVETCLEQDPRLRKSAKELLFLFPHDPSPATPLPARLRSSPPLDHRSAPKYIDPSAAMELDDVEDIKRERLQPPQDDQTPEETTHAYWTEGTGQYIDSVQSSAPVDLTSGGSTTLDPKPKLSVKNSFATLHGEREDGLSAEGGNELEGTGSESIEVHGKSKSRGEHDIDQTRILRKPGGTDGTQTEGLDGDSRKKAVKLPPHLEREREELGPLSHQDSGLGDDIHSGVGEEILGPITQAPGLTLYAMDGHHDNQQSSTSNRTNISIPTELAGVGAAWQ